MDSDLKSSVDNDNLNDAQLQKDIVYQQQPSIDKTVIKKHKGIKITVICLLIITIFTLLSYGIWYHSSKKNQEIKYKDAKFKSLQTELARSKSENKILTDKLATSGVAVTSNLNTNTTPTTTLSQADKDNIIASITSGNTAALEQKMSSTVLVILAASEGIGQRTPTQAVSDLSYITSAKQPWNFAPDAATLTNYQNGDYAKYFPSGAIVGTSADNKVVSFTIGDNGKITTIFMSADSALL